MNFGKECVAKDYCLLHLFSDRGNGKYGSLVL